jgi:hypothetical protein
MEGLLSISLKNPDLYKYMNTIIYPYTKLLKKVIQYKGDKEKGEFIERDIGSKDLNTDESKIDTLDFLKAMNGVYIYSKVIRNSYDYGK